MNTPIDTSLHTDILTPEELAKDVLKDLVSTFYQIQGLRIQLGNRLTAHFYRRLGVDAATTLLSQSQGPNKAKIELIDVLKIHWKRITDAFADPATNKKLMEKSTDALPLEPTDVISAKAKEKIWAGLSDETRGVFDSLLEWSLMAKYRDMIISEKRAENDMATALANFPIYTEWLSKIKGIGPTMGGVIISTINIHKADTPASIWAYAGLDVVILDNEGNPDGRGRGRYTGHLVEYAYTAKDGTQKTKKGITFSPFLKTKLVGVLADIMVKHRTPKYRLEYDNYKARITERELILTQEALTSGNVKFKVRTPKHLNRMAMRYMIKRFLVDLYMEWRAMEGLPITEEYGVRKLGLVHHAADGRWAQHMSTLTGPIASDDEDQDDSGDKTPAEEAETPDVF